jgi:hypothetical protein
MSSSRPSRARFARRIAFTPARQDGGYGRWLVPRSPIGCFALQLPTPTRGQPIVLGAPVVLGGAILEGDPSTLDQAMQSWVERALLHLQHIVRAVLDGLGNGMAACRSETQGPEDQQVQRPLQQLDSVAVVFLDMLGVELFACPPRMSRRAPASVNAKSLSAPQGSASGRVCHATPSTSMAKQPNSSPRRPSSVPRPKPPARPSVRPAIRQETRHSQESARSASFVLFNAKALFSSAATACLALRYGRVCSHCRTGRRSRPATAVWPLRVRSGSLSQPETGFGTAGLDGRSLRARSARPRVLNCQS